VEYQHIPLALTWGGTRSAAIAFPTDLNMP